MGEDKKFIFFAYIQVKEGFNPLILSRRTTVMVFPDCSGYTI